jgi:uncharacterized protein
MILIDSNIPMYLVGAAHPLKERSHEVVEKLVRNRKRLVTNAEVFQEICHRYQAIKRTDIIQPAFDILLNIVDEVLPITKKDVLRGKDLLLSYVRLSARDALHIAHMENNKIKEIFTFDKHFDQLAWISRIS